MRVLKIFKENYTKNSKKVEEIINSILTLKSRLAYNLKSFVSN